MTGAAQRYDELRIELELLRALQPEGLAQSIEADFAAELQRCWEAMTDQEQDEVEASLGGDAPQAPEQLDQEDDRVAAGERSLPRKAVAA